MTPTRAPTADDVWSDAAAYDRWFDTPWGRYAAQVETRAVLRALGNIEGKTTVDVGCGTGRLTATLRTAGADIIGVDPEPTMLNLARARIGPLVAGDALAIPIRDNTVDVAVAVTVLCFVADPSAAMAELARIVRPGGCILIGELNPHSPWGLAHRHEFTAPPWNAARFLTRQQLRSLGARYGHSKLRSTLYVPGVFPLHQLIGPVLEQVGRVMRSWGAFQILIVETTPDATSTRRPRAARGRATTRPWL
jgi:ubiquinone/menaquinone biosynthesis C-methylase UbiE